MSAVLITGPSVSVALSVPPLAIGDGVRWPPAPDRSSPLAGLKVKLPSSRIVRSPIGLPDASVIVAFSPLSKLSSVPSPLVSILKPVTRQRILVGIRVVGQHNCRWPACPR